MLDVLVQMEVCMMYPKYNLVCHGMALILILRGSVELKDMLEERLLC